MTPWLINELAGESPSCRNSGNCGMLYMRDCARGDLRKSDSSPTHQPAIVLATHGPARKAVLWATCMWDCTRGDRSRGLYLGGISARAIPCIAKAGPASARTDERGDAMGLVWATCMWDFTRGDRSRGLYLGGIFARAIPCIARAGPASARTDERGDAMGLVWATCMWDRTRGDRRLRPNEIKGPR
jgi:hypothetical protein